MEYLASFLQNGKRNLLFRVNVEGVWCFVAISLLQVYHLPHTKGSGGGPLKPPPVRTPLLEVTKLKLNLNLTATVSTITLKSVFVQLYLEVVATEFSAVQPV